MPRLNAYQLKWIAVVGMAFCHTAIALWNILPAWLAIPMNGAGGLTYPIMAYFVVEGYRRTSNLKRYIWRCVVVGFISWPFYYLAINVPFGSYGNMLNIMFSIAFSLIVLFVYDRVKPAAFFYLLYAVAVVWILGKYFDYTFLGVTMVLLYHVIRNEKWRRIVPAALVAVYMLVVAFMSYNVIVIQAGVPNPRNIVETADFTIARMAYCAGIFAAIFLLTRYSGERGKNIKWLFYVFYPLHLAILCAVILFLGLTDISALNIFM